MILGINEIVMYAQKQAKYHINKFAYDMPDEIKEELMSQALLAVVEKAETIDSEKGWKSFVNIKVHGAIIDYLKQGEGFEEDAKTLNVNDQFDKKIKYRADLATKNEDQLDLDTFLGMNGVFFEDNKIININWDLISRMSSKDDSLHMFVKFILSFTLEEIGSHFGISEQLVFAKIKDFVESIKSQRMFINPWQRQIIYGLGLCEMFDIPDIDQSEHFNFEIGWNYQPIDLYEIKKFEFKNDEQLSLFEAC